MEWEQSSRVTSDQVAATISGYFTAAGEVLEIFDKGAVSAVKGFGVGVTIVLEIPEIVNGFEEGGRPGFVQVAGLAGNNGGGAFGLALGRAAVASGLITVPAWAAVATVGVTAISISWGGEVLAKSLADWFTGKDGFQALATSQPQAQVESALRDYYASQSGFNFGGHCFASGTPISLAGGVDVPIEFRIFHLQAFHLGRRRHR